MSYPQLNANEISEFTKFIKLFELMANIFKVKWLKKSISSNCGFLIQVRVIQVIQTKHRPYVAL